MSQFTITVKDGGLIDAATEKSLTQSANYVANLLDRYIAWKGVLDIEIRVKPASELTWSNANGLLPSLGQRTWNGTGWTNSTLKECLTGVDVNTELPDVEWHPKLSHFEENLHPNLSHPNRLSCLIFEQGWARSDQRGNFEQITQTCPSRQGLHPAS